MPALLAAIVMTQAIHLYVSPGGSDTQTGSAENPLATLDGARRAARQFAGRPVIVEFGSGIYRMTKPVEFTKDDSGDVVYRAKQNSRVIFTGSSAFKPKWTTYKNPILQCPFPQGLKMDHVYIGGERQILARYPNEDLSVRIFHGYAKDAISPERVARWKDPAGGYLHAMHSQMWGDYHYLIKGKDAKGGLLLEGGWQNNRQMGMHAEYRFVEGVFEELDSPGEWFANQKTRTLFYYPRPGMDLKNAMVESPQTETILSINGAHGLSFQGMTFQHTVRTFMDNREPLLRSDWTICRKAAIYLHDAASCQFEDCTMENLGGNAVLLDGKNRHISIRRCEITQVGANAVAFVGRPDAVRSPLFEYGQRQSFASMDKQPGPKTDNYPADCLLEDCLIYKAGMVEKQSAGVEISMSAHITVRHCSIYDLPRAGINIGDGCWGGDVIEGCDVFDTVKETGDHGSFNSWGRDRYWALTDIDMNLGQHPELATLDMVAPNTLRNNRWRCDHGWDIDLDDGSSRYIIENNLCLNGGLKNREGFDRRVENNVIVENSFHPHVWFLNSGDVFKRNIIFTAYRPIEVHKPWGKDVDENFLHVADLREPTPATELAAQSGRDEHSIKGDAIFADPAKGDYRVSSNSPALKLGFRNFRMDDFGVRTPRLRAKAHVPVLTHGKLAVSSVPSAEWLGATLKELVDEGEISATGLASQGGLLVTKVSARTAAETLGLRTLDVILAINGQVVHDVAHLLPWAHLSDLKSLRIWRNQHPLTLHPANLKN